MITDGRIDMDTFVKTTNEGYPFSIRLLKPDMVAFTETDILFNVLTPNDLRYMDLAFLLIISFVYFKKKYSEAKLIFWFLKVFVHTKN